MQPITYQEGINTMGSNERLLQGVRSATDRACFYVARGDVNVARICARNAASNARPILEAFDTVSSLIEIRQNGAWELIEELPSATLRAAAIYAAAQSPRAKTPENASWWRGLEEFLLTAASDREDDEIENQIIHAETKQEFPSW